MPFDSMPIEVSCQEIKGRLDTQEDFLLLDCREPAEHATANIPQAKLIPMGELMARVSELEPYRDSSIVVHCHHGVRSLRVATWLRENGFEKAQSMAGGIDQWAAEISPEMTRY